MLHASGWIYQEGKFLPGSVTVEGGVIEDVSHRAARDPIAKGLILPAFANAHTHAGDAVVREELTGTLEELVAPPRGLKHRVLSAAKDEDVIAAMRAYFEDMLHTGTTSFGDFRELGVRGVRQLFAALVGLPLRPLVFGRPSGMSYDADEVRALLRTCDGIGISSLLDWDPWDARRLARDAHAAERMFATHASERVREDIDRVLDLKPDLLVHLTEATDSDLARVADAEVPVVACPRSNAFFGKLLDIPRIVRAGVPLLLGTDNAMINAPSMLREMDFAWKIARLRGGVEPRVLLDAALRGGTGLRGPDHPTVVPGDPADLIVLDVPGGRPTFGGVFRSVETDIALVCAGGRTWLREHGGLVELEPPKGRPRVARKRAPSRRRRHGSR